MNMKLAIPLVTAIGIAVILYVASRSPVTELIPLAWTMTGVLTALALIRLGQLGKQPRSTRGAEFEVPNPGGNKTGSRGHFLADDRHE